jgi:hypothetical protein
MPLPTDLEHHEKFHTVLEQELGFVEARWKEKVKCRHSWDEAQQRFSKDELRGLALSGGGIRSASFCMGVVQALHVDRVIDRLHYMSTVSGGGYIACSLTWFLSRNRRKGPRWGTQKDNFPFCGGAPAAIRAATEGGSTAPSAPLEGRTVLDFIRQRSSYLEPGAGLTKLSAAAIVLRSLFVSLLGYSLLAALIFLPLIHFQILDEGPGWHILSYPVRWPLAVAAMAAVLLGIFSALYSLVTPLPIGDRASYLYRRAYQIVSGTILTLGLAALMLALVSELIRYMTAGDVLSQARNFANLPILAALSAALGTGGGFLMKKLQDASGALLVRLATLIVPPAALILLIAALGAAGYMLAVQAYQGERWQLLVGATLLYAVYTNINLTGLHRFYRDRLMETFLPDAKSIEEDAPAGATSADCFDLSEICDEQDDGPYHLINGHVVLMGGRKARFRSRMGDNFLMSRLFCGSEATGYVRTKSWLKRRPLLPARPVGPLSLPTAMAISGAAMNPNTGADGQGITKSPAVSALMNLLNLRLGYWVPALRPGLTGRPRSHWYPPNFIFPGVLQGLLGISRHQNSNWLELTDGGHFENTGLYELVRRRVRTVILADGSTDPEIAMQSFANVLEKIYIDFNVTVSFDAAQADVHFINLMKGTGEPRDSIAEKLQFAKAGYAVATINYPKTADAPAMKGHLIYIKSTMVRDLPPALYSYKATNPLFPSESLADQFFSEQQFEAYRALGFALTRAMMRASSGKAWGEAMNPAPDEAPEEAAAR